MLIKALSNVRGQDVNYWMVARTTTDHIAGETTVVFYGFADEAQALAYPKEPLDTKTETIGTTNFKDKLLETAEDIVTELSEATYAVQNDKGEIVDTPKYQFYGAEKNEVIK